MIDAIKALPQAAQDLFNAVAQTSLASGNSEAIANSVAWEIVKSRFEPVGDVWVARTDAFVDTEYYTFDATPAESFITRTEEGTELHNYMLTDLLPDKFGTAPENEELMQEWANWLDEQKPELDVDHELFEKAKELFKGDIAKVASMMPSKKGIAKLAGARVRDKKLEVSILFDKRYANYVPKIRGVSLEGAFAVNKLTNKFTKGKILGLTLAMNYNPGNPRAVHI
jgi:hypothetical protein